MKKKLITVLFLFITVFGSFLVAPRPARAEWSTTDWVLTGLAPFTGGASLGVLALKKGGGYVIGKTVEGAAYLVEPIVRKVLAYLGYLWLIICSYILWFATIAFNFGISLTLNIKSFADSSGVKEAWIVIRDICNLLFLFAMIYMAITTIVDYGGGYQKLLKPLIIAALFINFSYLIAGVVIDASNIIAVGFYDAIAGGTSPVLLKDVSYDKILRTLTLPDENGAYQNTIGNTIFEKLGIPSITANPENKALNRNLNPGDDITTDAGFVAYSATLTSVIVRTVFGSLLMLIAAFVFFYAAILFLIRTVTLLYLLALAPMAFAGDILPTLASQSKDWWSNLINQSFFAPFFLLVLYVSMRFLDVVSLTGKDPATGLPYPIADAFQNGGTAVIAIFNYILVMSFFLATIKVATKAGAIGADKAQEYAGKASFGAAAWIGRQTGGRIASNLRESQTFKNFARSTGFVGKLANSGLDTVAKGNFDFRSTSKELSSRVGNAEQKGGYDKDLKDKVAAAAAYAQSLKQTDPLQLERLKVERDRAEAALKGVQAKTVGDATKPLKEKQNADIEELTRKRHAAESDALKIADKAFGEQKLKLENLKKAAGPKPTKEQNAEIFLENGKTKEAERRQAEAQARFNEKKAVIAKELEAEHSKALQKAETEAQKKNENDPEVARLRRRLLVAEDRLNPGKALARENRIFTAIRNKSGLTDENTEAGIGSVAKVPYVGRMAAAVNYLGIPKLLAHPLSTRPGRLAAADMDKGKTGKEGSDKDRVAEDRKWRAHMKENDLVFDNADAEYEARTQWKKDQEKKDKPPK